MELLFIVKNQHIYRVDKEKPVADSKNYLSAKFDFLTDEWTGVITIVFTKDDISYHVILDSNNTCLVPWELLQGKGDIYVSCFCDSLVTADSSRVHILQSGYTEEGENVEPATPSIYEQIVNQFNLSLNELKDQMLIIDGGTFDDGREN